MYGAYAGRRTRTHDHGGTVHACKPYGLHSRGVTGFLPEANIAEAGAKPLNSGGGEVYRIRDKSVHFPGKNRLEMQIDGSRPKFIVGKVYRNTGETVHFLPKKAKHAIPVCRICIAESTASRLALPRRNSISGRQAKYTRKSRAEQIYLIGMFRPDSFRWTEGSGFIEGSFSDFFVMFA